MRGERCAAVGGDNNSDDVAALVLGDNTGDNVSYQFRLVSGKNRKHKTGTMSYNPINTSD